MRHDVFRREQEFFDGRRKSALQHDRLRDIAKLLEEREILHIARSDLQNVSVFRHQFDVLRVENLGDDFQTCALAGLGKELQPFYGESLEVIGRSAWLVGAAAKNPGA